MSIAGRGDIGNHVGRFDGPNYIGALSGIMFYWRTLYVKAKVFDLKF
jgi:hypothetical protein